MCLQTPQQNKVNTIFQLVTHISWKPSGRKTDYSPQTRRWSLLGMQQMCVFNVLWQRMSWHSSSWHNSHNAVAYYMLLNNVCSMCEVLELSADPTNSIPTVPHIVDIPTHIHHTTPTLKVIIPSWRIKDQLDVIAISFHFLCAQHVSDINISIIRSLRLFCWITTLVVLFLVRWVLEFRCGWVGVVSVLQASACNRPTWCHLLFYFTSYVLNMFQTLIYPSYINVQNMLRA